jgi:mitochondrial chaperone BCS1
VYDIDICNVRSNTELRKLLIRMKNRSILLVEDVDCALATAPRRGDNGGSDESSPACKNREVSASYSILTSIDV